MALQTYCSGSKVRQNIMARRKQETKCLMAGMKTERSEVVLPPSWMLTNDRRTPESPFSQAPPSPTVILGTNLNTVLCRHLKCNLQHPRGLTLICQGFSYVSALPSPPLTPVDSEVTLASYPRLPGTRGYPPSTVPSAWM